MFKFFWEEIGGWLWTEEGMEDLVRLMARREIPELVPVVFSSRTAQSIYSGMSYTYRSTFIEHLIAIR